MRSRLEAIERFQGLTEANEKERVLQEHLFKNLWSSPGSGDRLIHPRLDGVRFLESFGTKEDSDAPPLPSRGSFSGDRVEPGDVGDDGQPELLTYRYGLLTGNRCREDRLSPGSLPRSV